MTATMIAVGVAVQQLATVLGGGGSDPGEPYEFQNGVDFQMQNAQSLDFN